MFSGVAGGSPEGLNQVEVGEFMKLHEGVEDLDVELISAGDKAQNIPDVTHTGSSTCSDTLQTPIKKRKYSFTYPSPKPVMTSSLTLPLRINDMPGGIMGRV